MKLHLYTHLPHNGAWLLPKTIKEYNERIWIIKVGKPKVEVAHRLCSIQEVPIKSLPPKLSKAWAAYMKARAAHDKAWDAHMKARAAHDRAGVACDRALVTYFNVLNSPEGVAFHNKVCGCMWSPEHPDILENLAR